MSSSHLESAELELVETEPETEFNKAQRRIRLFPPEEAPPMPELQQLPQAEEELEYQRRRNMDNVTMHDMQTGGEIKFKRSKESQYVFTLQSDIPLSALDDNGTDMQDWDY